MPNSKHVSRKLSRYSETWSTKNSQFNVGRYEIGDHPIEHSGNPRTGIISHAQAISSHDRNMLMSSHARFAKYGLELAFSLLTFDGMKSIQQDCPYGQIQQEIMGAQILVDETPWIPQNRTVVRLWELSKLKKPIKFSRDDVLFCLRGFHHGNTHELGAVLSPGRYSDAFHSMGSTNMSIAITEHDLKVMAAADQAADKLFAAEEIAQELKAEFPLAVTASDIIQAIYKGPPPFEEQAYCAALGVGGVILTADDNFVFVLRGNSVAVNHGVNITVSGAVDFAPHLRPTDSLQFLLARQLALEIFEEIGLATGTLGIGSQKLDIGHQPTSSRNPAQYELLFVGAVRELTRGGSPEFMYLVTYVGTTDELAAEIAKNRGGDLGEIDQYMYAIDRNEMEKFVYDKDCVTLLHPKAVANVLLILEQAYRPSS